MNTLALAFPGGWEWIIILVVGLLLFGKRLPEVGRSLGRGIVEFKKGIRGIEEEIDEKSAPPAPREAPAARPALRSTEPWEGGEIRAAQSTQQAPPPVGS